MSARSRARARCIALGHMRARIAGDAGGAPYSERTTPPLLRRHEEVLTAILGLVALIVVFFWMRAS